MLLCSVMLSFFTLFSKIASQQLPYFLITFLRFGVPFLLILPYLLWTTRIKDLFFTNNFTLQVLRCGCILVYQYSIFYYLLHSSLLNATVLQNAAPLFMPILERVLFGIKFHRKGAISILISFAGVLFILQPSRELLASLSIAAFLAPLGQAGSQVLYAHQARNENHKSNLFYLFLLTAVVSGAVYVGSLFVENGNTFASIQWIQGKNFSLFIVINLVLLGLTSIFNQSLRGLAYRYASASALAPFLYVSLLISVIFDWAFFHRLPGWMSLLGAALVVCGGMIQIHDRKRRA